MDILRHMKQSNMEMAYVIQKFSQEIRRRRVGDSSLQTLRKILGLPKLPSSRSPPLKFFDVLAIACFYLFILRQSMTHPEGPSSQSIADDRKRLDDHDLDLLDVIFIAIGLQFRKIGRKNSSFHITKLGYSILDSRTLHDQSTPKPVISTQHYRVGTEATRCKFGETGCASAHEITRILRQLFYLDAHPSSEKRNIIIVGHGVDSNLKSLQALGINLAQATSVVDIYDTSLSCQIFGESPSLAELTRMVDIISYDRDFHNAGNDANFALRAMLLLVIDGYDLKNIDECHRARIRFYKRVGSLWRLGKTRYEP
jgi:hypothetical protein